jgi:transposase
VSSQSEIADLGERRNGSWFPIGPIWAALLVALIQTPHRFRTKRQLWAYSSMALKTYASGEYRFIGGQLKRSQKLLAIRGLNTNHNHDLKNTFKGAGTRAAAVSGPCRISTPLWSPRG